MPRVKIKSGTFEDSVEEELESCVHYSIIYSNNYFRPNGINIICDT